MTEKPWYQSKTKWGGILLALGTCAPGVAKGLSTGDWTEAILAGVQASGMVLGTFGLRNALAPQSPSP